MQVKKLELKFQLSTLINSELNWENSSVSVKQNKEIIGR
jgi:hypothetical protein